ncbi:MAG TPA: TetR/AcrR family transcriptional regulator [Bosea sp. (in: a-proteobacteria)]|jgi:AcrR family transcriptional regulator|nr:TetR/AcrR family transcriptional regulator [Bosea sp. (in: a-proteobacteria)]
MKTNTPATLGVRERQRVETRRDLVQAGLRIVAKNGFANTTTAAIAREIGRAHGTVFVHFPTRESLVIELVNEIGRIVTARLAGIPSDNMGLAQALDAHLAALGDQEVLLCQVLRETTALPPSARALLFALQSGIAVRIRAGLDHDIAAGKARAFDPVALANIWIALTNHYLINRDLFAPEGSVIAAHGDMLKQHLLSIVAT